MAKVNKSRKKTKSKKQIRVYKNPDAHLQVADFNDLFGEYFGDYAKYVIQSRSLPDVRDGLLPVQRRTLFSMNESGFKFARPTVKSAKIVGNVMGEYHPHGDSGIYGALSRMAKPWVMGIPSIDFQGNRGSIDGDNPAAMRYCLTNGLVSLADDTLIELNEIVPNSLPNTEYDIDIFVKDFNGSKVHASKFFNSGKHKVIEVTFSNDITIKGTYNHPLYTKIADSEYGWKLLEDISVGDYVLGLTSELIKCYPNTQLEGLISDNFYTDLEVKSVVLLEKEEYVYSIKVDSDDHSFIANGMINHNTEARLSKYSEDILLSNLKHKGIVPEVFNYDDTKKEPVYLPAKLPNILINGSEGIGVGFASGMLPFNIIEVLDACIVLLENPEIEDSELITYIPAPDFPTGGLISDYKSYQNILLEGKGSFKVRGNYTIEDDTEQKTKNIVFSDIPYGCLKPKVIDTINDAIQNKEVSGIVEVRDNSDKDGIVFVVECRDDANIGAILSFLFSKTDLRMNVPLNSTVINNGTPELLSIPQVIRIFNDFRKETITLGLKIQIKKEKRELHIVEGLIKLVENLDVIIDLIKESESKAHAREQLEDKFDFTTIQANKVLELQLHRVNKSDASKYQEEKVAIERSINQKENILSNDVYIIQAMIIAYNKLKEEYDFPRKTTLKVEAENWDYKPELIVHKENVAVGLSEDGFIKVSNARSYSTSKTADNNEFKYVLETDTRQNLLFILSNGDYGYVPIHRIPQSRWSDNPKHLSTLGLDTGSEKVIFATMFDGENKDLNLFLLKNNGVGKQSSMLSYVKNKGFMSISAGAKCKEGEYFIDGFVIDTNVNNYIALMDNQYANMYFEAEEMPLTGVRSGGANAMKLNKKQERYILEYALFHDKSEIPEFCQPRERGQSGWNRTKTEGKVSIYEFLKEQQELKEKELEQQETEQQDITEE